MHYSLDVVLALYFTVTVWSSYHRIANDIIIGHRFSNVWVIDSLLIYPAIEWIESDDVLFVENDGDNEHHTSYPEESKGDESYDSSSPARNPSPKVSKRSSRVQKNIPPPQRRRSKRQAKTNEDSLDAGGSKIQQPSRRSKRTRLTINTRDL